MNHQKYIVFLLFFLIIEISCQCCKIPTKKQPGQTCTYVTNTSPSTKTNTSPFTKTNTSPSTKANTSPSTKTNTSPSTKTNTSPFTEDCERKYNTAMIRVFGSRIDFKGVKNKKNFPIFNKALASGEYNEYIESVCSNSPILRKEINTLLNVKNQGSLISKETIDLLMKMFQLHHIAYDKQKLIRQEKISDSNKSEKHKAVIKQFITAINKDSKLLALINKIGKHPAGAEIISDKWFLKTIDAFCKVINFIRKTCFDNVNLSK